MTLSDSDLRAIVERVVRRTLGASPASLPPSAGAPSSAPALPGESLVTRAPTASPGAAPQQGPGAHSSRGQAGGAIALGADHGGFQLKETLKAHLESLGYSVVDCGTNSTDAVDYPDFAYAVARLVSEGTAWRGIAVDGAGIGSAMAANKVPGVRAALCYDHASAVNSREHNDANVLTLGAGLIGSALARQIVEVWLKTEFGGGRHTRRVDKIVEIEKRFLKR